MLSILLNFVFTIISKIADLILSPIISLIAFLIPSFSSFYNGILSFVDYGLTYFTFFLKALCIPQPCMIAVLTVATSTLAITLGLRSYQLIMTIYREFKP